MLACACLPVAPRTAVHATTPTTPNPHPLTHWSIGSIQLLFIQKGSFLQDLSPTIYHLFSIFQGRIIVLHKGQTHKKKLLFLWILSKSPPPPPRPPIGHLVHHFADINIQDLKVSLELKILCATYHTTYCILKLK